MQDSPVRSLAVLLAVALVCSILVSVSAINLRPIQMQNELIERYRNIVALTGQAPSGAGLDDEAILRAARKLDVRVVNLDTGQFETDVPPESVDALAAENDPARSVPIPVEADFARLGRRSILQVIYLVWEEGRLARVILPVHGQGMWSTLRGFLALEADLNTIAAVSFYEQAETAGLGDQIENPEWQARWTGRKLFGSAGDFRFRIASGRVADGTPQAVHEVDGLSGATITAGAVTDLVRFWVGPAGYGPLLATLRRQPPDQVAAVRETGGAESGSNRTGIADDRT